jgi:hypothetical protein
MSTKDDYKAVENFIFVSPAPADTAAKLSSIYRFIFVALIKDKFDCYSFYSIFGCINP